MGEEKSPVEKEKRVENCYDGGAIRVTGACPYICYMWRAQDTTLFLEAFRRGGKGRQMGARVTEFYVRSSSQWVLHHFHVFR